MLQFFINNSAEISTLSTGGPIRFCGLRCEQLLQELSSVTGFVHKAYGILIVMRVIARRAKWNTG
jgi:hypothetical protein